MNETFDPKDLPDWIRAAFDQALSASRAPSVLDYRDQDAWPLLVEAAVVRSFLPRDLAPETAANENRSEAEQTVLRFAETTYAPEGVQWTLTPDYRMQVVQAALASGELPKAIESTAERFKDDVSEALRTCLLRPGLNLESFANLKLTALEGARAAIASLSGVKELELPSLDRFDREIELRRLLAQFERMIGVPSKAQAKASDRKDLFFGRTEELESLRAYVGVIPADSLLDTARRARDWVARRIKGRAPLMVSGIGGAGKTTLISKFMLEHAKAAISRYPFAYLDFDRTTISARQRLGLLAEMCAQTAAQFDQLSEPMAALQSEIRQLSHDLEVKGDFESNSFVEPYCRRFRKLIDDLLDSLENEWWSRPFLLVFDTFEVVQYTDGEIDGQDDIKNLEEFIQGFSNDDTELWPRLRLIISGRQRVTRFLGQVEELSIGALDPQGSADLLAALAADAGRPITEAEAKKLVDAVAKVIKEKNRGVLPLRLRLIGEVFRQSDGGGKQVAESLLEELTQPLGSSGAAAKLLIDGILVTRILNHVADKRVKALADPGLVVRRITPEVIKEVMTRGTTKPDLTKPGSPDPTAEPDTEVVDPWIVDDDEAESIFKAFRREVSLVEREGDALRHRADVRQQMLPLILARRPKRFRSLNRLAFDHFRHLAEKNVEDFASAAEAIYHGLWLEESLELIDSFWRNSQKFRPRLDPNEFKEGSHAHIYVRARTRKPLKPAEVSKLPKGVALDWVDARSKALLENRRVEESIQAIRNAAGPQYEGLDDRVESAAVLTRLLYRAGLWDESAELALRHLKDVTAADLKVVAGDEKSAGRVAALVSLIRTLATIVGKSGVSAQELNWISSMIPAIEDPIARVEVCAHVIVACAQFGNQWRSLSQTIMGQHLKPSTLAIQPSDWLKDKKLLRLVIMSDEECYLLQLLTIWIGASDRVPRDVSHSSLAFLLSEVFKDSALSSTVENILAELKLETGRSAFHKLDKLWRDHRETFLEAVNTRSEIRPLIRALVAADNYDWIRPLGNSLTRAFKSADGPALTTALEKANFRVATGKRDRKLRADGVAVVQAALDDGQLMELATTIFQRSGVPKRERGGEWEYPQNISSLCRSLLRWQATLNPGDREGSWTDAPQLESRLKRAVDSFDWPQAEAICEEVVNRIHNAIDRIPEATARRLMNTLRRKRRFTQMIGLAKEILASGLQTAQVKRLYAQALIDLDRFDEAEVVLNGMIHDPSVTPGEINEARGLIGRVFKQKYINNNDPDSEFNRQNLVRALEEYENVYKLDRRQYLWHGINVVALLSRAERDHVPVKSSLRMQDVAREVLSTLEEREQTSNLDLPAFDVATQLEAYVALGRESDAAGTALRYVDCLDADAFEIHSTKRQLTEVWQLNNTDTPGKHILPILQAAQLEKEGLFDEKPKNVLDEVVAVSTAVQDLETLFGADRTVSLRWYQKGLEQCNSIARVERKNGQGIGTGFLVNAKDFMPSLDGVLLVTADHIIGDAPHQYSIPPEEAQVRFQALNEVFEIDRIVWSSPYTNLDVAFLALKGQPKAPPLRIHEKPVVMTTPTPRLYIIGHPRGRDLEISLRDNHLLACNDRVLHYSTPSEPGSSGSPVFESTAWEVVAVHHRGSSFMKRLDGEGTYEANEGISILTIRKAIRESLS